MSQLGRTEKRKARAPGEAEDPKAGEQSEPTTEVDSPATGGARGGRG